MIADRLAGSKWKNAEAGRKKKQGERETMSQIKFVKKHHEFEMVKNCVLQFIIYLAYCSDPR